MIKRLFVCLLAVLALIVTALPLAACQNSEAPKNETSISVWVRKTDYRPYIENVFSMYQSETGNKLDVKIITEDKFDSELKAAFKNGNGPDILLHYNDSSLAALDIEKNFLELNDQKWVDSIMSGARAYSDDGNGNLIGLPFWESSVSGCYYNKAILSGFGLKPATNQSEFDMLCQALKSVGVTPLFWGENCGWMYQFGLDPIFADNSSLLKELNDGKITYADIPQIKNMVQWIYDAYAKGWLGEVKTGSYENVSAPMASGKTAMVNIWDTWFEEDFVPGKYTVDDFAVMPVFMGTATEGTYEGGNLNMMLVNKNSKHQKEALEFLSYCAQPEILNKVFDGVPSVKVFKEQNTIVTADMLVDAASSIAKLERASTAYPKIMGYSQEDMKTAFKALFAGQVDVDGCINMMDKLRLAAKATM